MKDGTRDRPSSSSDPVAARRRPVSAKPIKGHKSGLPSKLRVACGRPMSWRRKWAKNWDDVKYCSEACRAKRSSTSS